MTGRLQSRAMVLCLLASLCVTGQAAKPVISAIVNAASYGSGPIAPGEMVILFGSGLGPSKLVSLQVNAQGKVADVLASVQVLFDGVPAPLIYTSESQLAAMVPYSLTGRVTTLVRVVYTGISSDAFSTAVAATSPGIFSADASGKGQGAIGNSDGSPNSLANPASPGSYVTLYLTGEGQTDPPGSDGNIAVGVANVKARISVRIAGRTAQLLYAGSAPGNVNGFAQINVVIPADLQYGGNLPVVVQIGDASSQSEITVAVSGPAAPILNAPVSVSAAAIPPNQIWVGWNAVDALASRFHVERRTGSSGPFTEIAAVAVPPFTITDSSVAPGTTYQYRVRAENDYGYSPYSAIASATVPVSQVAPPSSVQTVAVSQTQVNLTWNATNTNATSFQIERKAGAAGNYTTLATVPSPATTYQDRTVTANTAYVYRMRSQAPSGFSGYSNESTVTTPAVPLPPAPTLTATALSSSQIRLSWTSTATGIVRFRIERRTSVSQYSEINQPGSTSVTYDDSGLSASAAYLYRMRVETGSGLSPYSNDVTATTLQGLPATPTNLQATATSTTQVSLSWENNAPDATAIRVEYRPPGSITFTDIFAASTLTSTGVANLLPNTAYSFRVRAQNAAGYSGYSNQGTVTTLPKTTVFVIHGIAQGSADIQSLAFSLGDLSSPDKLDLSRYSVNASFDWTECANKSNCGQDCTVQAGAAKLANYIAAAAPKGDIVLVAYSLGGLLAREAIASYPSLFAGRRVAALITLGTPHLGYPYASIDNISRCPTLVRQMDGDYRSSSDPAFPRLSTYLEGLTQRWGSISLDVRPRNWLAMAGTFCRNPERSWLNSVGCSDTYPYSDGVVCQTSAYFFKATTTTLPTDGWSNATFSHSDNTILCTTQRFLNYYNVLYKPPMGSGLLKKVRDLINGL